MGCADLSLASDVWIKRNGNEAIVGCHSSQQTWRLQCLHSLWDGAIGNCSTGTCASWLIASFMCALQELMWHPSSSAITPSLCPKVFYTIINPHQTLKIHYYADVVFVIIGCCTLFVAIGVVTMGYVCLKWSVLDNIQL